MRTDEDEIFIDNMIIEFSYDLNEKNKWNWKPLRIRYDKTTRYKQGIMNMVIHFMLQIVIGLL